jgi:transcriptional regulator with XRE-family HTH domain
MNMNHSSKNECAAFGEFVKTTRLRNGIIARDAALNAGILPSNFSKLEHGALAPVQNIEKQKKLAVAIGIELDSDLAANFFDLAAKATNSLPADLSEIISRDEALPLLLRTLGNKRLEQKDIERLLSIVRETHDPPDNSQAQPSQSGDDGAKLPKRECSGNV